MSDRDWLRYLFSFLVAATLVAWAFLTQPNAPSALESNSKADQACPSEQYKIGAGAGDGPSLTISRHSPSCEEKAKTENNTEDAENRSLTTAEADLLAQERMAHWTKWIGIFTAAGLAVLFVTFDATRAAVLETRTIGEKQSDPYLNFEGGKHYDIPRMHCFDVMVKNSGVTPAKIIGARARVEKSAFIYAEENKPETFEPVIVRRPSVIPAKGAREFRIFFDENISELSELHKNDILEIILTIDFENVFDRKTEVEIVAASSNVINGEGNLRAV